LGWVKLKPVLIPKGRAHKEKEKTGVASRAQPRGKFVDRKDAKKGIGNVGVSRRTTVEQRAPKYAVCVKTGGIQAGQNRVLGKNEVETRHDAAWARGAFDFTNGGKV
jgi:hypothetical protein